MTDRGSLTLSEQEVSRVYATLLPDLKQIGHQWRGRCPIHGGEDDNFVVAPDTGLYHCHSQCQEGGTIVNLIMEIKGLELQQAKQYLSELLGRRAQARSSSQITAAYDYRDEDGNLLYQAVRLEPGQRGKKKSFFQRRPDGNGGWINNLNGTRFVLYRLPELMAGSRVVYIAEGEKDVDRLYSLGVTATCNPMGAGKWRDTFCDHLRDRQIVILPDNDPVGRAHAAAVARSLSGKALSVKVLQLPDLADGADLSDWLDSGGNLALLHSLTEETPEWVEATGGTDARPEVLLGQRIRDRARALIDGLLECNHPPHIFQRDRDLLRIIKVPKPASSGTPWTLIIDPFRVPTLRVHASERLDVFVEQKPDDDESKQVPRDPSKDDIEYILGLESWPFPRLEAILHAPSFTPAGELVAKEGYSPEGCVYLDLGGFELPDVPEKPSDAEVERAKVLILDELLGDFPFVDDASRAHAVALGLLPFIRLMIDGPTPLHFISAPVMGTGKSMLAVIMSLIATGHYPTVMGEGRDDEEWRKRITSTLQDSPAYIQIDNIKRKLDSGNLMAVLTTQEWTDRVLGQTQNTTLRNLSIWTATGNNPAMSVEFGRRVIWIYMDPRTEKPWERTGFKHHPLVPWVKKHRRELAWAFLILIRNWISNGQPRSSAVMGSYESWAQIVGGILDTAGIPGFLGNRDEMFDRTDSDAAEWKEFVSIWWRSHESFPIGTSELAKLAGGHDLLSGVFRNASNDRQLSQRLAHALKKRIDCVIGGFKIVKAEWDTHKSSNRYRLLSVEPAQSPEAPEDSGSSSCLGPQLPPAHNDVYEWFAAQAAELAEVTPRTDENGDRSIAQAFNEIQGSATCCASALQPPNALSPASGSSSGSATCGSSAEVVDPGTLFPRKYMSSNESHWDN